MNRWENLKKNNLMQFRYDKPYAIFQHRKGKIKKYVELKGTFQTYSP